jgi:hypothetical protein
LSTVSSSTGEPWWNVYDLPPARHRRFGIGALELYLERRDLDWAVGHRWNRLEDRDHWTTEDVDGFPEDLTVERYVVGSELDCVRLEALTADRPVVARPRMPLRIKDGLTARIFVGSPLWVGIALGCEEVSLELPSQRLKQTFFGSNTRSGELAYGLETNARLDLDHLTPAPHQLVTPVSIENRSGATLTVNRLNLPVPFLSVYAGKTGVWSEQVRFVAQDSSSSARFEVTPGPPSDSVGNKITDPRRVAPSGHVFRAFSSLLGF